MNRSNVSGAGGAQEHGRYYGGIVEPQIEVADARQSQQQAGCFTRIYSAARPREIVIGILNNALAPGLLAKPPQLRTVQLL